MKGRRASAQTRRPLGPGEEGGAAHAALLEATQTTVMAILCSPHVCLTNVNYGVSLTCLYMAM